MQQWWVLIASFSFSDVSNAYALLLDICTLRLDFEMFSIQGTGGTNQPNEGVCSMDTFTITVNGQFKLLGFLMFKYVSMFIQLYFLNFRLQQLLKFQSYVASILANTVRMVLQRRVAIQSLTSFFLLQCMLTLGPTMETQQCCHLHSLE